MLLAETGQQPLAARWAAQVGRFWNSVLSADEASLVQRALHNSCALAVEAGGVWLAGQPWAGQVAATLHAYGATVDLRQPQPVGVSDIVEAAAASFRQQLYTAQGTRIREYVAATGADTADGLPGYLFTLQHRGRWRALAGAPARIGWRRRRGAGSVSSGRTGYALIVRQRASGMWRMCNTHCFDAHGLRSCALSTPCFSPLHILSLCMHFSLSLMPSNFPISVVLCTDCTATNS